MTELATATDTAASAPADTSAPSAPSSDSSSPPSHAPANEALDLDSEPFEARDLDKPSPRHLVKKESSDTASIREQRARAEREDVARTRDLRIDKSRRQSDARSPIDPDRQRPQQNAIENLRGAIQREFADVKSLEDVQRLEKSDPARHARLRSATEQLEAAARELQGQDPTKRADEMREVEKRTARPKDMPRSWGNEDAEVWALTPEPLRKSIATREREREKYFLKAVSDARQYGHRAEQHTVAAQQLVVDGLMALTPEWEQFLDLRSPEAVAQMHASDPDRAAAYEALKEKTIALKKKSDAFTQARQAQAAQQMKQVQAAQAQQFESYRQAHSEEFSRRYPNVTTEDEKAIIDGLQQHYELSPQDIARLAQLPQMSSWQGRAILHDALAWRRAQVKFKDTVRPVQPARALRPGAPEPRSAGTELEEAAKRGDMTRFFKLRSQGKQR